MKMGMYGMIEKQFSIDFSGNSITIRLMQENRKFVILEFGLFVITFLFWAIWIIRAYAWVEYKDTQAAILGTVLIALAVVMLAIVYLLFRLARPSYLLLKRKRKIVIVMVSVAMVILFNFFMLYRYRDYGYTISSIAQITLKESEGGNFYFQVVDGEDGKAIRFACDEETYMALKEEENIQYNIQYRRVSFGNRKAVLGYIDIRNTIEGTEDEEQES